MRSARSNDRPETTSDLPPVRPRRRSSSRVHPPPPPNMPTSRRLLGALSALLLLRLSPGAREPPCPPNLSVPVAAEDAELLPDGGLLHAGSLYPAGSHWPEANGTTLRACFCQRAGGLPCLRKCCGPGELVGPGPGRRERCAPRLGPGPGSLALPPERLAPDMRAELAARPELADWYELLASHGCEEGLVFMDLEPESYPEDAYLLQRNGSLWLRTLGLLGPGRFCVDLQQQQQQQQTAGEAGTLRVIACVERAAEPEEEETPAIVWIGYLLSLPFLACTFVVYAVIPELRNIYGKTLMCYVLALLSAYGSISVANFFFYGTGCFVTAYIVHFSFLASFFWLNVMCFDIWWTFGGFRSLHGSVKQRERKKFIMYSIYAWGSATLITVVCMIMDLVPNIPASFIKPEFGKGSCWFQNHTARFLYFYLPMGLTIICNICLFVLTAVKILRHKKDTARQLRGSESRRHDDNKQWFNLYLKLFIVMGINWSMEIISWIFEDKLPGYVWYISDLANTLQGVIIFVIFVWKDKIKRLLMKRFGCQGNGFLSRHSTTRSGCPTSSASRTTCLSAAPLQEKANLYTDTYRGKATAQTDESDCI